MKNFITTLGLIFSTSVALAQVPKKVVAEHFTNTLCSICASRNPGFYSNLNNFPSVLHLAVHPSAPYVGCTLSHHNVSENNSRTNYYGIFGGTPRIVIQGSVIPSSANYSDPSIFSPFTGQSSPASIKITQTKFANDSIRSRIRIKTEGTHSLGNLRLFISLAEDTVFFNAPNGETQHHDVFRKSLGGAQGMTVNLPANVGDSVVVTLSSTVHAAWNFSRIFTLAILQEESTKAMVQAEGVLANGNTLITDIKNNEQEIDLRISPNPSSHSVYVCINSNRESTYTLIDGLGRSVLNGQFQTYGNIDISTLEGGVYNLIIFTDKGKISRKVIKQ